MPPLFCLIPKRLTGATTAEGPIDVIDERSQPGHGGRLGLRKSARASHISLYVFVSAFSAS